MLFDTFVTVDQLDPTSLITISYDSCNGYRPPRYKPRLPEPWVETLAPNWEAAAVDLLAIGCDVHVHCSYASRWARISPEAARTVDDLRRVLWASYGIIARPGEGERRPRPTSYSEKMALCRTAEEAAGKRGNRNKLRVPFWWGARRFYATRSAFGVHVEDERGREVAAKYWRS